MRKNGMGIRLLVCFASLMTAVFIAAVLAVVFCCRDSGPVLLAAPEEAACHAEILMEAVCSGDFAKAESLLYGSPSLGVDGEPDNLVGAMIWDRYISSLDYVLVGSLYAGDSGLVQDVKLISLDLTAVTDHLGVRAKALLNEAMASAEDVSELYDENNEYREELVAEILQTAVRQALEEDVRYTYQIVPLRLVYQDGQWWGVADKTFLHAVSGGITQ